MVGPWWGIRAQHLPARGHSCSSIHSRGLEGLHQNQLLCAHLVAGALEVVHALVAGHDDGLGQLSGQRGRVPAPQGWRGPGVGLGFRVCRAPSRCLGRGFGGWGARGNGPSGKPSSTGRADVPRSSGGLKALVPRSKLHCLAESRLSRTAGGYKRIARSNAMQTELQTFKLHGAEPFRGLWPSHGGHGDDQRAPAQGHEPGGHRDHLRAAAATGRPMLRARGQGPCSGTMLRGPCLGAC